MSFFNFILHCLCRLKFILIFISISIKTCKHSFSFCIHMSGERFKKSYSHIDNHLMGNFSVTAAVFVVALKIKMSTHFVDLIIQSAYYFIIQRSTNIVLGIEINSNSIHFINKILSRTFSTGLFWKCVEHLFSFNEMRRNLHQQCMNNGKQLWWLLIDSCTHHKSYIHQEPRIYFL